MTPTQEFDLLVSEHIDGAPNRNSTQRLSEMIRKNPALRREFTDQIMMHDLLSQYWNGKPRRRAVLDRKPKAKPALRQKKQGLIEWLLKPFRRTAD